ncbi:hypothetical protein Bca4012_093661 [Brassica carinata]
MREIREVVGERSEEKKIGRQEREIEFSKLTQVIHLDVPITHTKRTPIFTFTHMDQLIEQTNKA